MPTPLPPGWRKPSASFAARDKRAALPWDGLTPTSHGPNSEVRSTINDGSQRHGRTPTFSRATRFSAARQVSPGPAAYDSPGRSSSAAILGSGPASRIELPWEAPAKEAGTKPGPGAYHNAEKKMTRSASDAAFKSRTPRFRGESSRSPGAAAYSPQNYQVAQSDGLFHAAKNSPSSAFASQSTRELQLIEGEPNLVGPGQYNGFAGLTLVADINRSARLKSSVFTSQSPRFRAHVSPRNSTPGPAEYDPRHMKTDYSTTQAYSASASF